MTDCKETADFYFAMGVLDELDLLQSDANWNTPEAHVASLKQFGSERLANGRMHAAFWLADLEDPGPEALAALRDAILDEDHRVRVTAHFALHRLGDSTAPHVEALRYYMADGVGISVQLAARDALERLGLVPSRESRSTRGRSPSND